MRIELKRNGKPIGFIDYDVQDPDEYTGRIRSIQVKPAELGRKILKYLRTNPDDVRIWGGQPVASLEPYLEGLASGLDRLKLQTKGLDWSWPIEKLVPRSTIEVDGEEVRVG